MSCLLSRDIYSENKKQFNKILRSCRISSKPSKYNQIITTTIECLGFDEYKNLIIPFYTYNLLGLESSSPNFEKQNFTFTSTLHTKQLSLKDEVLPILKKLRCCVISGHPGIGKTRFAVYLASKINLPVVIVIGLKLVAEQWKHEISQFLDGSRIQHIKTATTRIDKTANVIIISPKIACSLGKNSFLHIGFVIFDECHLICSPKYWLCLQQFFPKYVVGLSATPYKANGLDQILDLHFGPTKIIRKLHQHHLLYPIYTKIKPTFPKNTRGELDWMGILRELSMHEMRNGLILTLAKELYKLQNSFILISCKLKDQVRYLYRKLKDECTSIATLMESDTTFDTDAKILITTYSKSGVGFNHPKLNHWIVACDAQESYEQYHGRLFRREEGCPKIYDLVDDMSSLYRHFITRRNYCEAAGGEVKKFREEYKEVWEEYADILRKE